MFVGPRVGDLFGADLVSTVGSLGGRWKRRPSALICIQMTGIGGAGVRGVRAVGFGMGHDETRPLSTFLIYVISYSFILWESFCPLRFLERCALFSWSIRKKRKGWTIADFIIVPFCSFFLLLLLSFFVVCLFGIE